MSIIAEIAVQRIYEMHPKQSVSVVTFLDASTETYVSTYIYPIAGTSGLGHEGAAYQGATICLHQIDNETAPYEDCTITTEAGEVFNISNVETSLNFTTGQSVFTCTCTRKA